MRVARLKLLAAVMATCVAACRDAEPIEHPEPVQFSVEPGVYLLAAEVDPHTRHEILGREVVLLASGAVFIMPREGQHGLPSSEKVPPEFQRLQGVLNANHQVAYLSETEIESGAVYFFRASPIALDRHTGLLMRVGHPLTSIALEIPPPLPPGTPYVQAVAHAPRSVCRSSPLKTCPEPSYEEPVAVLVAGVGGPPGFASVTFDAAGVASIKFKTTLWTRLVIHVRSETDEVSRFLWASERYDLLRDVAPYRSLSEEQRAEQSEFFRTVLAEAPEGFTPSSQSEVIVTFVDWSAPDISHTVLTDWDAWTAFVKTLPPEWIRYSDGSAEFPDPESTP